MASNFYVNLFDQLNPPKNILNTVWPPHAKIDKASQAWTLI